MKWLKMVFSDGSAILKRKGNDRIIKGECREEGGKEFSRGTADCFSG